MPTSLCGFAHIGDGISTTPRSAFRGPAPIGSPGRATLRGSGKYAEPRCMD
jgi:hypothetical protein